MVGLSRCALTALVTGVLCAACARSPAGKAEAQFPQRSEQSPDALAFVLGRGTAPALAERSGSSDVLDVQNALCRPVSDERIAQVLLQELSRDPHVGRERIRVSVDLGTVTLQGRVSNQLVKERAVIWAQVVRGARTIVDRIEVVARPLPDEQLEFIIAGVLSRDPTVATQRIAARAHGGTVELSGSADSFATRRIAQDDVFAIQGVREVYNDVAVRPQYVADDRIRETVERVMREDPWLDGSRIQVRTRGGVVNLSGSVRSAAERARAEFDAHTASPEAVDVTGLRIEGPADGATVRAMPGVSPSDEDMAQALLDAYGVDPRLDSFVPKVEVEHRVAVLTGLAPSEQALLAAEDDARNTPGILDVRNDVRAQAAAAKRTDASVLSALMEAIARDPWLAKLKLDVEVHSGRVRLRGAVPSTEDRMHAISVASTVPGAIDVDDHLQVIPPRLGVAEAQPER